MNRANQLDNPEESRLSRLCEAFERDLSETQPVSIEQFLQDVPELERETALRALLAAEIQCRRNRGERLSLADYASRFPSQATWIDDQIGKVESESLACQSTQSQSPADSDMPWFSRQSQPLGEPSPPSLGRYQLKSRIAAGGFGEVWLAFDPDLERTVAIKVARSDRYQSDELQRESFLEEARKLALLRHPGIVPVYDVGQQSDRCFIVAEFIEGETLGARMKREPFSQEEAADLVATIAEALHYAHLQGIVHRDIKPANILLDRKEYPFVADFGLAVSEVEQLSERAAVMGTLTYMSPEQARGESHLTDARSDVYSLGVVLYELLTARRPFAADTPSSYREQLLSRTPRPLRTIDDSISRELERICMRCLEKNPRDRYSTAHDVAEDLRRWLNKTTAPARHRSYRYPAGIAFATASLAALLAVAAWNAFSPDVTSQSGSSPSGESSNEASSSALIPSPIAHTPFGWRNQLGQDPRELVWPGYTGTGSLGFREDLRAYEIASDEVRIVQLGSLIGEEASLSIGIKQPLWIGATGLFFGYRIVDHDGRPCARFQVVSLSKTRLDGKQVLQIDRSIAIVTPDSGILKPILRLKAQTVEWPIQGETPRLELDFRDNGQRLALTAVRWGNTELDELTGEPIDSHVSADEYIGPWGIFVQYGTTWFCSPIVTP